MRREIETVPKDGTLVILEDEARGAYELARWSTEQNAWVGEDDKAIPIIATYWLPLRQDECLLPEDDKHVAQTEAEACVPPDPPIRNILPLHHHPQIGLRSIGRRRRRMSLRFG